jgi:hypothetical protein
MFLMYRLFRNNPTQESLDTIIKNATRFVSYASPNTKGTGITTEAAAAFSRGWLATYDEHAHASAPLTYQEKIDENFNQILEEVDMISKHGCTEDARAIYLNLIQEYAKKIKTVYQL